MNVGRCHFRTQSLEELKALAATAVAAPTSFPRLDATPNISHHVFQAGLTSAVWSGCGCPPPPLAPWTWPFRAFRARRPPGLSPSAAYWEPFCAAMVEEGLQEAPPHDGFGAGSGGNK